MVEALGGDVVEVLVCDGLVPVGRVRASGGFDSGGDGYGAGHRGRVNEGLIGSVAGRYRGGNCDCWGWDAKCGWRASCDLALFVEEEENSSGD